MKSITFAGKEGGEKMANIMNMLHSEKLEKIGPSKVLGTKDYLKDTYTTDAGVVPTGLPKSNVLYYELEGGAWVCVRPSGTEPKIKIYINAVTNDPAKTTALLGEYAQAMNELLGV